MILFNLLCPDDHAFEGWFQSGIRYQEQADGGQIRCPVCAASDIRKAPMAPNISSGVARRQDAFSQLRAVIETHFDNVGDQFAEQARQIHYGEADPRPIRGQASLAEADALREEGIAVLPLPWVNDHDA